MSSIETDKKEKLIDLMTLNNIDGVGVNRLYRLINTFGSAGAALEASISELTDVPDIGRETASKIKQNQDRAKTIKIIEDIIARDWGMFIYDDENYPQPLKNIVDRPPYLFYFGDYNENDFNAVAIVGSRVSTDEARSFTESLAVQLAENGVTVVSGMARGIDTSAHRGAIKAKGRTIAVFGSSLDIIYPPESREIAQQITQNGCIFSEFLPGTEPYGPNFPRRNRIISGLSQAVIVVEAAEKSGAISTAGHALAQNREVFAVPGPPRRESSRGTNMLIKQGARLLTSVEDIFTELPRLRGDIKARQVQDFEDLTDTEKKVLEFFAEGPIHIDKLSRHLDKPIPDLLQILLALELKGIVKELAGKRYILA
jgi:DNA processing protein